MKNGFTLIEVLIVSLITIALTTSLVTNFSRTRSQLPNTSVGMVNNVRQAQNRAVSGALHKGVHRCGYGVFFEAGRYVVYAGPEPDAQNGCSEDNFQWDPGRDSPVLIVLAPAGLTFSDGDVYFEPPFPTTYVNGVPDQDLTIQVTEPGARCPSNGCRTITINAAGQIQSQ